MTSANGFIDRTARNAGKLPLPRIVATMLGVASAFFCFAMPQDVLDALLGGLGVPGPIGPVGRTLFLLVFTALVAGIGWLVVTVAGAAGSATQIEPELDLAPLQPRRRSFNPSDPSEALNAPVPTLLAVRRGDAHPDAPPRRPIFADHDLAPLDGEFTEIDGDRVEDGEFQAVTDETPEAVGEPLPAAQADEPANDPVAVEAEAVPATPVVAKASEVQVEVAEPVSLTVVEEPLDLTEALPVDAASTSAEAVEAAVEPQSSELEPELVEPEPEAAEVEPAPAPTDPDPAAAAPPPPTVVAVPPQPVSDRSLSELMARLETGLDRRVGDLPPPPKADTVRPAGEPALAPEEALRQALEALQRMAARQR